MGQSGLPGPPGPPGQAGPPGIHGTIGVFPGGARGVMAPPLFEDSIILLV